MRGLRVGESAIAKTLACEAGPDAHMRGGSGGGEIGLDWVCFGGVGGVGGFHNSVF